MESAITLTVSAFTCVFFSLKFAHDFGGIKGECVLVYSSFLVFLSRNIISFSFFLWPLPSINRIFEKTTVEEFQSYPYLCIFYSAPAVKMDVLVFGVNCAGCTIVLQCLALYTRHENDGKKRLFVVYILLGEAVLTAVIVVVAVLCFHSRRSVEYMPLCLSLGVFSNAIYWTIYALFHFDMVILVSNGLGTIFGAIQLLLYAYFYFNGNNLRPCEEAIGGP
ncbi:hypothetical protein GQ457_02G020730 [Hibiscus cannabinus]